MSIGLRILPAVMASMLGMTRPGKTGNGLSPRRDGQKKSALSWIVSNARKIKP